MKYALFLGCTIPARSRHYEASARSVCAAAGLDLVDVPEFACCGFPIKAMDAEQALLLGARNLALAERLGLPILTLCSSCTSALAETARELEHDARLRDEVNRRLARIGLRCGEGWQVEHVVQALHRQVGLDSLRGHMVSDLSSLRVATHHGCHFLKPSEVHGFDSVENPTSLDDLVSLSRACVIDYPGKTRCCGGPVMAYDPATAVEVARTKLVSLAPLHPDALILACPFCSVMYEANQKNMAADSEEPFQLPVLFITQILGLGMGVPPDKLGFKQNIVKPKKLLAKLGY